MLRSGRFTFALLAAIALAAAPGRSQPVVETIDVSVRGEPAQPGSVLVITAISSIDVESVSARAFGQTATFVRDGSARRWRGLVGVDVATTESSSLVTTATLGSGKSLLTTQPLAFKTRQFPTRRLRVASQFVDPSPAELERIKTEAQRLEDIFAAVTMTEHVDAFVAPLPGVPGNNFGSRSIFNGEPRAPHAGADFRGAAGTPIPAPAAGRVVLAEDLFFTGQTVVIDHGAGLYSLLAHLSRIDVAPG